MGALMLVLWAVRFFAFRLYESPKYLMGKGEDEHAVKVIHKIARYNGKPSSLSLKDLQSVDKECDGEADSNGKRKEFGSTNRTLRRHLSIFDGNHVKPLFATRKLAVSTILLIVLWGKCHVSIYLETMTSRFPSMSIDRACFPAVRKDLICYVFPLKIETRYNSFVTY